jgi:hypothetical protein
MSSIYDRLRLGGGGSGDGGRRILSTVCLSSSARHYSQRVSNGGAVGVGGLTLSIVRVRRRGLGGGCGRVRQIGGSWLTLAGCGCARVGCRGRLDRVLVRLGRRRRRRRQYFRLRLQGGALVRVLRSDGASSRRSTRQAMGNGGHNARRGAAGLLLRRLCGIGRDWSHGGGAEDAEGAGRSDLEATPR